MATKHEPQVRVGQVWADNDKRWPGRTVEVIALEGKRGEPAARVKVLTMDDWSAGRLKAARDAGYTGRGGVYLPTGWTPEDTVGKESVILVRRFRPNSTGYRLVKDVDE